MSGRHVVLALAVALVWGVNFVAMKAGLATLPPFLFAFLRFALAAFPLVFFVRRPPVPWRSLWAYALTQFSAQYALLFWGLELGMPAGLSSAVVQLQAFLTIALAALFLAERPRATQLAGAAVAFVGLAVIGAHVEGRTTLVGLALEMAAALAWAFGNIMTRRIAVAAHAAGEAIDPMQLVSWASLLAMLPLAALSLIFEGPAAIGHAFVVADWRAVGTLLFNAYAVTTFGFGAWSFLMRRYSATVVAPFALLAPVAGMLSAALLLDEPLHGWALAAAALVIAGIAIDQVASRRRMATAGVR